MPKKPNREPCTHCGNVKPASEFTPKNQSTCRACVTDAVSQRASNTYQAYCRRLVVNARSKSKRGVRNNGALSGSFNINEEDVIKLWEKQKGQCALSGVFLTHHRDGQGAKEHNASIDRINPTKGYEPKNVQLVALRVNVMKSTLGEDMFYWWVKTIHNFSCD